MTKTFKYWLLAYLTALTIVLLVADFGWITHGKPEPRKVTEAEAAILAACLSNYKMDIGLIVPSENRNVVMALTGQNPKHKIYIQRSELHLNQNGEAVDPFGNLFVFSYSDGFPQVSSSSSGIVVRDTTY